MFFTAVLKERDAGALFSDVFGSKLFRETNRSNIKLEYYNSKNGCKVIRCGNGPISVCSCVSLRTLKSWLVAHHHVSTAHSDQHDYSLPAGSILD